MTGKWTKSEFPGVRYREHKKRNHGVKKDRYFIISYRLDGKRKDESIGWASKGFTAKKANAILAELQENHRKGISPRTLKEKRELEKQKREAEYEKLKQERKGNVTFSDFFYKKYLPVTSNHKRLNTVKIEKAHFNKWLKPEIGNMPIRKISAFNLEKIKKKMIDADRAPRSIQHVFSTFRQAWNHARLNDFVTEASPTRKVKLTKVENQRLRFLSYDEAEALLTALKKISQQVHDITLFSLHTGARAGEIFALTWGVIDFDNDFVLIRDSKGKPRHVYLTNAIKNMLKGLYTNQPESELVFKGKNGIQIKSMSNTFDRTVKKLGFNNGVTDRRDKVVFHTCRHTFASWHIQNGTDLYTVKELLGHSTIQLTERYSHLKPDGLKKAVERFDKKINNSNVVLFKNVDDA